MDMTDAGEASVAAGKLSGKTTRISFVATSEQWEHFKNGKRLRNKTSEQVSAPRDWRSRMQCSVRPQVRQVTQLPQTINRMAKMLGEHAAPEEAQWLGMKVSQEDRERNWDERHKDDVQWGMGVAHMTAEVLAKARVFEAAPAKKVRNKEEMKLQGRTGEA